MEGWQQELEQKMLNNEISIDDGDIDRFAYEHLIPIYAAYKCYYQIRLKGTVCEGCKNAGTFPDYHPCLFCKRRYTKDYFEKEE